MTYWLLTFQRRRDDDTYVETSIIIKAEDRRQVGHIAECIPDTDECYTMNQLLPTDKLEDVL